MKIDKPLNKETKPIFYLQNLTYTKIYMTVESWIWNFKLKKIKGGNTVHSFLYKKINQ